MPRDAWWVRTRSCAFSIMRSSIVGVLALAGCLAPDTTVCENGDVCPSGLVCAPPGSGLVCILATCGDGSLDLGERCDDGNNESGDLCPADCLSDGSCGNHLIDDDETCDDGDHRSHDGCSSTCAAETLTWTRLDTQPPGRVGHAMAYDPERARVVLFGGCPGNACDGALLRDTWEWDGTRWIERPTAGSPSGRFGHALAYDRGSRRVILFGGCSAASATGGCDQPLDDTWEWDGTAWKEALTLRRPAARTGAAMVYSPEYGRVMMFGGSSGGDETWMLGAEGWGQPSPLSSPPARAHHALVYDARRGRIVLFGGEDPQGTPLADTWEWDYATANGTWVRSGAAPAPPARAFHALVYDVVAGEVVLLGGCHAARGALACTDPLDDRWRWNGERWVDATPTVRPSARSCAAAAYDPGRGRTVLFGGRDASGLVVDTWELERSTWLRRMPFALPQIQPAMSYDPLRGAIVLFDRDRTWESTEGTWVERAVAPPRGAPEGMPMAYDAARRHTVLFGGQRSAPPFPRALGDTWTWDGAAWTEQHPSTYPTPRAGHSSAYDVARGRVVLFGGYGQDYVNDTWEWDGTNWLAALPATSPRPRVVAAMAYDPKRQRVVMFGGADRTEWPDFGDTWEWDGTSWFERRPSGGPSPRHGGKRCVNPT